MHAHQTEAPQLDNVITSQPVQRHAKSWCAWFTLKYGNFTTTTKSRFRCEILQELERRNHAYAPSFVTQKVREKHRVTPLLYGMAIQ